MPLSRIKFAGGGERFQYLTHKGNDTTIRFLLRYPGAVDADAFRAAAKRIVESVDILHSSFFTDPNLACYGSYTAEDQSHIQKTLDSIAAVITDYAAA